MTKNNNKKYVLAFDTSNEVIAVGVGVIEGESAGQALAGGDVYDDGKIASARPEGARSAKTISCVRETQVKAHRQSNTRLLECVQATMQNAGVSKQDIACVACGTGPGSFTGVRIALACAKGIASALGVGLLGVSTLDSIAWGAHAAGVRGHVQVVADAMRKEVYPLQYALDAEGVRRLEHESVIKAQDFAERLGAEGGREPSLKIAGDALGKYGDVFAVANTSLEFLPEDLWQPSGRGLLLAAQSAWRAGVADPFDAARHNPAFALPTYTRLSDAEENERARNRVAEGNTAPATSAAPPSASTAQTAATSAANAAASKPRAAATHKTMNSTAKNNARGNAEGVAYVPLNATHTSAVAQLEAQLMGSDAWNEQQIADELNQTNRIWWMALACPPGEPLPPDAPVIGYVALMVVADEAQLLKIAVAQAHQHRGIAHTLLTRAADDARSLGAKKVLLEVRKGNTAARAFYESHGFSHLGCRAHYYSDGEDAAIMQVSMSSLLAPKKHAAGGMIFEHMEYGDCKPTQPLIFAIESSCDETAAAIVDGEGNILASVVASQIDFHARFGGVVPEIASRKHIEAICGVCEECFDRANAALGLDGADGAGITSSRATSDGSDSARATSDGSDSARDASAANPAQNTPITWQNISAISATYAPGLLGALVVGVAFAKGASWGAGVPYIGVNHLEGHLYANKIGNPSFAPPALVSLVSGGNTLLVHMKDWGSYETLGYTIDDAVGEAFDKVAKALGLGYPGGPVISKMAAAGNAAAIEFPRAMMHSGDYRFSLSGLKTAVVTYINNERAAGRPLNVPDICASFTAAVVDVQVAKAKRALKDTGVKQFCLGGGVAANPMLREAYEKMCKREGVSLSMPPLSACGDNAAMIALVALDRYKAGKFFPLNSDAQAHANLDEPY